MEQATGGAEKGSLFICKTGTLEHVKNVSGQAKKEVYFRGGVGGRKIS